MAANSRFAMAIHIISILASHRDEFVSSSEVADSVNTNPVVVRRILTALADKNIIESCEGKSGGSKLVRCPEDVSLWEIYEALGEEHLFAIHQNPVKRSCEISCGMKDALSGIFGRAEAAARKELRKTTVRDVLHAL